MDPIAASKRWQLDIRFIEHGDIYFFFKPKKEPERVGGIDDVSRFYIVLDPSGSKTQPRYVVIGSKRMPKVDDGGKNSWGFVQMVGGRGFKTYQRPTQKRLKTASRPAGEGIYAIVGHRSHTHLLYKLELPQKLGPVQEAFNIKPEANYVFMERPISISPNSPDEPFSNFKPATTTNLNQRGTEVLFVGVGADIGRLGISATADAETLDSADIFTKLQLDESRHPTTSLISGDWE